MSTPSTVAAPITKVATVPLARQRLRREAAALRRSAHPNVVRMVSFVDAAERTELRLDHAGEHTLVTMPPPDGPAALACGASLAATVADLHAMGVVHGRLTGDHVVIRPDGRPVVCGLSEAREGDAMADILALATLLEVLATSVPQPGTRRDRRAVASLLTVAERARTADPAPAASEIAALLGGRAARPRLGPGEGRVNRRRRPAAIAAVAAAAAMVAVAGWALSRSVRGSHEPTLLGTVAPSTPVSALPLVESRDPSAEPVRFDVDGAVYAAGSQGDVVVTGDWDCDGTVGAALLRPGTGAVFVFDRLAGAGEALEGRSIADAPGAVALDVVGQPDGCDSLIARQADGRVDVLVVAP